MGGCYDTPDHNTDNETYWSNDIKVVTIDSCEYIISHVYGGNAIIHKQNCKFCEARRKMNNIIYDESNSLQIAIDTSVMATRSFVTEKHPHKK